MNKLAYSLLIICIITLLIVPALSAQEKVYIVNLQYAHDGFTIKDVQVKNGYAPDRALQQGQFHAELISEQNAVMYGFNFEVPLLLFTDGSQGGRMHGSVLKLNETDFVLVMPYYENAALTIRDTSKSTAGKEFIASLSPESVTRRLVKMGLWMAAGGIILVVFLVLKKKGNKQAPPQYNYRENPYQMPPGSY